MNGYVARKGERWYAVIYDGLDPVTGKERRTWHPAGTSREEAERLAAALAAKVNGRNDQVRSLTFGAYLATRWLPGKKLEVAHSAWDGYRRKIELHIIPTLGKVPVRRLRPIHLERLYDQKLHPKNGRRPLSPKSVLEVHLTIRGALNDADRRGIVTRNVAQVTHAPKLRSIPKVEQQAWTAPELRLFLVKPPATACSLPSGFSPIPDCDAANSSDCNETTSTSTTPPCQSTGDSCRSATNSTNHAARRPTRGVQSTSTPPP
jgi:hypothetical protein